MQLTAFWFIILEIAVFFILSLALLEMGLTWNYAIPPLAIILSAYVSKKYLDISNKLCLNKSEK